jgi:hypothetical protein
MPRARSPGAAPLRSLYATGVGTPIAEAARFQQAYRHVVSDSSRKELKKESFTNYNERVALFTAGKGKIKVRLAAWAMGIRIEYLLAPCTTESCQSWEFLMHA